MAGFGGSTIIGGTLDVTSHIDRFFRAQLMLPGLCSIAAKGGLGKTTLSTSICAFWESVHTEFVFPYSLIAKGHIDARMGGIFIARFLTVALQDPFGTFLDNCGKEGSRLAKELDTIRNLINDAIGDVPDDELGRALLLTFRESSDNLRSLYDYVTGLSHAKIGVSDLKSNGLHMISFLVATGNFERFIIELLDNSSFKLKGDEAIFVKTPGVCGAFTKLFGPVSHLRSEFTAAAPGLQMATPVANADVYNFFDSRSGSGCVIHGSPSIMLGFSVLFSCVRVSTVGDPHTTHILNGETLKGGLSAKIPAIIQEYNDSSMEIGARVVVETRDEYSMSSGTPAQIMESMGRLSSSSRLSLISMEMGEWILRVRDYFSSFDDSDVINKIGHADGFFDLRLNQCWHYPGPTVEPKVHAKDLRHLWPVSGSALIDPTYNKAKKALSGHNGVFLMKLLSNEV